MLFGNDNALRIEIQVVTHGKTREKRERERNEKDDNDTRGICAGTDSEEHPN